MSTLNPMSNINFDGMTLTEASQLLGKPREATRNWLCDRGWRLVRGGIHLRRSRPAQEIADEINERIQAMRPQSNCFLCGARGECRHR